MKASEIDPPVLLGEDRKLMERLPVAIYTCDKEGYIIQYNQSSVDLWGREPVKGKDRWCGSLRIFRPDGSPLAMDECPTAVTIQTGKASDKVEIIIEIPGGFHKNVLVHSHPIHNKSGELTGAVSMLVDITTKRNESKLRESEYRLRLATEGTGLGTWDMNLQTNDLIFSPLLAAIFGVDASLKLSQQDLRQLIHPEDRDSIARKAFERSMETGECNYEARIVRPDKAIRWIRTLGTVIFNDHHVPVRLIGTTKDVTEERRRKAKLKSWLPSSIFRRRDCRDHNERRCEQLEQGG